MAKSEYPRIATMPNDQQTKALSEAYALALGKVAHAWNYLFESLGGLFVLAARGDHNVASAVWYAPDSDRIKLVMLEAAIDATRSPWWMPEFPSAQDDIKWLAKKVHDLMDLRNNVIHAPCILVTDADGSAIQASYGGHSRAKKLWGKEILVEFDWCERWTEELAKFARLMDRSLRERHHSWPGRPARPDRTSKKILLSRLLLE